MFEMSEAALRAACKIGYKECEVDYWWGTSWAIVARVVSKAQKDEMIKNIMSRAGMRPPRLCF